LKFVRLDWKHLRSLLVALLVGGVASCGGESASHSRLDAAVDRAVDAGADRPAVDAGVDGGAPDTATDAGVDAGSDAASTDAADGRGVDAADSGVVVLPPFVSVWTFDQVSQGVDGWARAFGLTSATISYDPNVGAPNPGSLVLDVPFSSPSGGEQYAVQGTLMADLTHRQVWALMRLESGGPAQGRVAFSSTSSYVIVISPPVTLTPGMWTMVTLDVDNPPPGSFIDTTHTDGDGGVVPPTPSDTRVISVLVNTAYAPGTYTEAVVHVDTIGYY